MYGQHPQLQWAAMANLIGPSFYAGFLDIGIIPDAERAVIDALGRGIATGRRTVRTLTRRKQISDEVALEGWGFFETTFLTMQRKIFEDQALMHEAYLGAGLDAIGELASAGIIDSATAEAWNQINSDDPAAIRAGNRTLLYREQHDIIDRFYNNMRAYDPPQGEAFTYLLTLAGSPAVPGANGYSAIFPLTIIAAAPGGQLAVRTPLPDGNIALFADRWNLIEQDTLPAFERFITGNTAEARALIATPIAARVQRFRTARRLGVIASALTRWQIRFQDRAHAPRRIRPSGLAAAAVPARGAVTINLSAPPTRAAAGFSPTSDHRVWGTSHGTFDLTVKLPRGRAFTIAAELAVMLTTASDRKPARLTVKLPPTDLQGASATLSELARDWDVDADEIAQWSSAASRVTSSEHAYSTRVFRAAPVEFVRLEFQVEHHVIEQQYVIDVLFAWE